MSPNIHSSLCHLVSNCSRTTLRIHRGHDSGYQIWSRRNNVVSWSTSTNILGFMSSAPNVMMTWPISELLLTLCFLTWEMPLVLCSIESFRYSIFSEQFFIPLGFKKCVCMNNKRCNHILHSSLILDVNSTTDKHPHHTPSSACYNSHFSFHNTSHFPTIQILQQRMSVIILVVALRYYTITSNGHWEEISILWSNASTHFFALGNGWYCYSDCLSILSLETIMS